MCPKTNETESYLSMKSHVEDLAEPFPDLFSVLTEEKDRLLRWTSYTYPVELSIISVGKDVQIVTSNDIFLFFVRMSLIKFYCILEIHCSLVYINCSKK